MKENTFWNDAARYGMVLGLVAIAFLTAGYYVQHALLTWASFLISVGLLTYFTKRRVARCATPQTGCGYGKCLGFMVCVMLFAGFIEGAFTALAANWLFVAHYDAQLGQAIALLDGTGFYSRDQLALAMKWMHSPLWLVVCTMLGSAAKGGFFGLFIAAFTKREPDLFSSDSNSDL